MSNHEWRSSLKSKVTLREITKETVRAICDLSVRDEQKKFVAPNAVSIAQAYFSHHAWFRAIYGDEIAETLGGVSFGGARPAFPWMPTR